MIHGHNRPHLFIKKTLRISKTKDIPTTALPEPIDYRSNQSWFGFFLNNALSKRLLLLSPLPLFHSQCSIEKITSSAIPRETNYRRVGRPRQFWTTTTMERAWELMKFEDTSLPQVSFDKSNRHIREMIIEHARQYKRPFTNKKN